MEFRWFEILVASIVAALLLMVEHYTPLQTILKKHQTVNYIQGTIALIIPQTVLFLIWNQWQVVIAIWSITIFGGLAVIGSYVIDHWIDIRVRLVVAEREAKILRPRDEQ